MTKRERGASVDAALLIGVLVGGERGPYAGTQSVLELKGDPSRILDVSDVARRCLKRLSHPSDVSAS